MVNEARETLADYFSRDVIADAECLPQLEKQIAELQAELKQQSELTAKFQAIAEPPKEKFFKSGHYTSEVDLTALEVIANLGVSANVVPQLYLLFGRFYGIKVLSRKKKVQSGTGQCW